MSEGPGDGQSEDVSFDNIDHDILLELLKRRIDDDKFIELIKGMLKAGYMEDWIFERTYSGHHRAGSLLPERKR